MPKISVIVPVYKAEEYLRDCIDSILSQTLSDFEVILVDDGSPDGSGAICEEYAARDSRISVIHQENRGQAAARNHALTQAKGQWICFVDSDDLIHPQTLELLYHAATDSGVPISMCEMLEAVELPEDFFQSRDRAYEVLSMDEETLVKLHDMDAYPAWVACAKLIRREIIEKHLFCEGRVFEDNEAVCHWICEAKMLAKYDQKLYFYRKNPESTTKSTFSMKKLDYLWALESIIRFYSSIGYSQMRQRFFERYVEAVVSCCNGVRHMLGRPDEVREIEKSVKQFLREEKLHLTRKQFEALLDAMHPKLIGFYWLAAGAVRRMTKLFKKGEAE